MARTARTHAAVLAASARDSHAAACEAEAEAFERAAARGWDCPPPPAQQRLDFASPLPQLQPAAPHHRCVRPPPAVRGRRVVILCAAL